MRNGYFRPPEGFIDSKALVVRKRYGSLSASLLRQAAVKVGRWCPPPPVLCPQLRCMVDLLLLCRHLADNMNGLGETSPLAHYTSSDGKCHSDSKSGRDTLQMGLARRPAEQNPQGPLQKGSRCHFIPITVGSMMPAPFCRCSPERPFVLPKSLEERGRCLGGPSMGEALPARSMPPPGSMPCRVSKGGPLLTQAQEKKKIPGVPSNPIRRLEGKPTAVRGHRRAVGNRRHVEGNYSGPLGNAKATNKTCGPS